MGTGWPAGRRRSFFPLWHGCGTHHQSGKVGDEEVQGGGEIRRPDEPTDMGVDDLGWDTDACHKTLKTQLVHGHCLQLPNSLLTEVR
jgi:hypothetical protein